MNRSNCHFLLCKCTTLKQLQQIHAQTITQSLHPHIQSLSCKILNLYSSKFSKPDDSLNVFNQIPNPDLITLTSLINHYLQTNQPKKAILVFSDVIASGQKPDGFIVVSALSGSGQMGHLGLGKCVHGLICRHRLGFETVVNNALIDMYCRNGRIKHAQMIFSTMCNKDSVSWSSMLHGHVMCNGLEFACKIFDEMPQRDVVSWTVMITGHVQGKCPICALELFRGMKMEGHRPTLITFVSVLSACADIGASDLGCVIHGCIVKMNLGLDATVVYNALIDMYSKSGDLKAAHEIFAGMVGKDLYTWTTMISGLAVHGKGELAIKLFREMLNSKVRPNEVTFVAVLLACSHSGLVDDGRNWFKDMREVYKLKPQTEHYGCMINLLGRAGLLSEANKLIQEMDTEPDCVIWRSLLSASLVHGDVEFAEIAGMAILKKEPDDDGIYVLLWNMYATLNRWDKALEMRKKMRDRKVMKRPGCSWIELDGCVHEFSVGDRMHCLRKDIYLILEGMGQHLRMESTTFFKDEWMMTFLKDNEASTLSSCLATS